jgi:hypothetical protein
VPIKHVIGYCLSSLYHILFLSSSLSYHIYIIFWPSNEPLRYRSLTKIHVFNDNSRSVPTNTLALKLIRSGVDLYFGRSDLKSIYVKYLLDLTHNIGYFREKCLQLNEMCDEIYICEIPFRSDT